MKTLAWIQFSSLNFDFYDGSFLLSLASMVKKPIKVDTNTLRAKRGKFTRMYVELDPAKPVLGFKSGACDIQHGRAL